MIKSHRERWEDRYAAGPTPWDTQQTPPEVQAFWQSGLLPPVGLALDVGCGPGTNVFYLARLGLRAIGFDIAYQAVQTGQARIRRQAAPGVAARTLLVQADVTTLPVQHAGAAYILDLGCSHGLVPDQRSLFVASVVSNLQAGGYYHLYGFDAVAQVEADRPLGFGPDEVLERFTPALELISIELAQPDPHPCRWYLLRKPL